MGLEPGPALDCIAVFLRFSSICSYKLKGLEAGPAGKFSRHKQHGYQPDGATLPGTSETKTSQAVKYRSSRAPASPVNTPDLTLLLL